jgi:uncharacterized protein (TIGR02996 family)
VPLEHSSSPEAFKRNVAELIRAGHPRAQALAAAYAIKRKAAARKGRRKYAAESGGHDEYLRNIHQTRDPRAILHYADWLQEQGGDRHALGTLLRAQAEHLSSVFSKSSWYSPSLKYHTYEPELPMPAPGGILVSASGDSGGYDSIHSPSVAIRTYLPHPNGHNPRLQLTTYHTPDEAVALLGGFREHPHHAGNQMGKVAFQFLQRGSYFGSVAGDESHNPFGVVSRRMFEAERQWRRGQGRRRYAQYKAPAGGMVVRGTNYPGGDFLPKEATEPPRQAVFNQPAPTGSQSGNPDHPPEATPGASNPGREGDQGVNAVVAHARQNGNADESLIANVLTARHLGDWALLLAESSDPQRPYVLGAHKEHPDRAQAEAGGSETYWRAVTAGEAEKLGFEVKKKRRYRAGAVRRYNHEAFLGSILANLGDKGPALVWADRLEEQGNPLGTLIRRAMTDEPNNPPQWFDVFPSGRRNSLYQPGVARGEHIFPFGGTPERPFIQSGVIGNRNGVAVLGNLQAHIALPPFERSPMPPSGRTRRRRPPMFGDVGSTIYPHLTFTTKPIPIAEAHALAKQFAPDLVEHVLDHFERNVPSLREQPRRESRFGTVRRYTATGHEEFQKAVMADPLNPEPKLVYADFLDERGHPGGDYLRLLHQAYGHVATLPPAAPGEWQHWQRYYQTGGPVSRWLRGLPRTLALLSFHTTGMPGHPRPPHPVAAAGDKAFHDAVAAAELHAAGLMSSGRMREVQERALQANHDFAQLANSAVTPESRHALPPAARHELPWVFNAQVAAARVAAPNDALTAMTVPGNVVNRGVPHRILLIHGQGPFEADNPGQRRLASLAKWFTSNHPLARRLRNAARAVEANSRVNFGAYGEPHTPPPPREYGRFGGAVEGLLRRFLRSGGAVRNYAMSHAAMLPHLQAITDQTVSSHDPYRRVEPTGVFADRLEEAGDPRGAIVRRVFDRKVQAVEQGRPELADAWNAGGQSSFGEVRIPLKDGSQLHVAVKRASNRHRKPTGVSVTWVVPSRYYDAWFHRMYPEGNEDRQGYSTRVYPGGMVHHDEHFRVHYHSPTEARALLDAIASEGLEGEHPPTVHEYTRRHDTIAGAHEMIDRHYGPRPKVD